MIIPVLGFDPSLLNWGIASGTLDTQTKEVKIQTLDVIKPVSLPGKSLRVNSNDLYRAQQLAEATFHAAGQVPMLFVEVPVGSQSARAMASYGVCLGILASLRSQGFPFYEITPTEVKKVATGKSTATKKEMIQWAMEKNPEAPWPTQTKKGITSVVVGTAEHMADAVGTIYAGIETQTFQQYIELLTHTQKPNQ